MAGLPLLAATLLLFAPAAPKQLSIEQPAIQQFDGGPNLASDFRFAAGESVYFEFAIRNYKRSEDDKISLSWNAEVRDSAGIRLILPLFGKVTEELAPEDKEWVPKVRFEIPIPSHALSGKYSIAILVTDDLAKTTATRDFSFEVQGHAVEPAASVEIRNVGFFRIGRRSETAGHRGVRSGGHGVDPVRNRGVQTGGAEPVRCRLRDRGAASHGRATACAGGGG